ncbi:MAG: DNA polymerase III subunit gamma/tau [Desulfosudaceae bacterium]
MTYLVLARKYRPQTFADVIQQEAVTRTLSNAIAADRMAHAVLFTGPRGTGKTTIARILAKAMNCENGPAPVPCNQCRSCREITDGHAADVFEIDGASNNSVDQVRELRGNLRFLPAHSPYKIYIIDEVHMLSTPAFNALLKTLEEPPAHVLFFFATTEPHKIPATILSRCQRHDLTYVGMTAIVDHLEKLCRQEGCRVEPAGLQLIARQAGGSVRDALSLLDQVLSCAEDGLSADRVGELLGIMDTESIYDLTAALLGKDIPGIMAVLDKTYQSGLDIKKLYSALMEHIRNLLMVKMGLTPETLPSLAAQDMERLKRQAEPVSDVSLNQILSFLLDREEHVKFSSRPRIAVELALIKIVQSPPALPLDSLIEKIEALKDRFREIADADSGSPPGPGGSAAVPSAAADISGRGTSPKGDPPAVAGVPAAADSGQETPAADDHRKTAPVPPPTDPAEAWEQILARVDRDHPLLAANLINSTLSHLETGKMEIEIYGSRVNLNLLRQEQQFATLQQVCNEFFQHNMEIAITHKLDAGAAPESAPQQQEIQRHPLVGEALEIFGGDIINT